MEEVEIPAPLGGGPHVERGVEPSQRFEHLAAWTSERFPIGAVDFRWSGQIVEPVDGLPYIGLNSFCEHVWEATGYGGNGMTFGTLAGMITSLDIARWVAEQTGYLHPPRQAAQARPRTATADPSSGHTWLEPATPRAATARP